MLEAVERLILHWVYSCTLSLLMLFHSLMGGGGNMFVYTAEVLVAGITKRDEWRLIEVVRYYAMSEVLLIPS